MRENAVVAALGMPGTGKSHILHARHTSRAPHVISLGVLKQDVARDRNTIIVAGWAELTAMLRRTPDFDRWHIAAALEPDEEQRLFSLLVPPKGKGRSLAEALGGLAIEASEAYDVFPNSGASRESLRAIRQGRHYRLDMYLASQRAASCARDVTAAASELYLFAQGEPNDLDYIERTVSRTVARYVARLDPDSHECIYVRRPRVIEHWSATGDVIERIDPMAEIRERFGA